MRSITADLLVELATLKLRAAVMQLRRISLAHIAARLPTSLLDDARMATTEELARRGLHVITHRSQPRNVA